MKRCTSCKLKKPLSEYHVKSLKDGTFHTQCKLCVSFLKAIKYKHAKIREKHATLDEIKLEQWRQESQKNRSELLEKWIGTGEVY